MEALILSCSTGGGHNSAAHALCQELQAMGFEAQVMDPYSLQSDSLANLVGQAYVSLVQFSPYLFGKVYQIGAGYEKLESHLPIGSPVLYKQKKTALLLKKYMDEHPVDVIVCTHMYPGMMITQLKNQGIPVPPSILVTTDYTCIPFETQAHCDWTVIACDQIRDEFLQWHVDPHSLLPIGIPVRPAFEKKHDRSALRKQFGIDENARVIFCAGGSMGLSAMSSLIKEHLVPLLQEEENTVLAVSCGHNKELLEDLEKLNHPRLRPLGYVDNMDEWLAAADVYITKPGGLSITESANIGIPMILCYPIPGCESANSNLFEKEGMAIQASNAQEVMEALETLKDEKKAEEMKLHQRQFLPHDARRRIAHLASGLAFTHLRHR